MERLKHIKKMNELLSTDGDITAQHVVDILFDMGAKIIDVLHEKGQSEILFEHNGKKAKLYCLSNSRKLYVAQNDLQIKSLTVIKTVEDLVSVLGELLKRVV